ncbi:MAG: hypothetical protein AAF696_02385, partial [Bacteroidota bacterium]
MKKRIRKIGRILGICLLIMVSGVFISVYALRFPSVQNALLYKIKGALEREMGTEVSLMAVDAALPTYAILEGVEIPDKEGKDFLKVGAVRVDLLNFSLWEYLFNSEPVHKVSISDLQLFNPELYLYRNPVDSSYNIPFDFSLFSSSDTTANLRPLRFVLQDVSIIQGRLRFQDATHPFSDSIFTKRLNVNNLWLKGVNSHFSMTFSPGEKLDSRISSFSLQEVHSGLAVDSLSMTLATTFDNKEKGISPSLELKDLALRIEQTHIVGDLLFPEVGLAEVLNSDFSEYFEIDLKKSTLELDKLHYFLADSLAVRGMLDLRGKVTGHLSNLKSDAFFMGLSDSSSIYTNFSLKEILDPDKRRIELLFRSPGIALADVRDHIPQLNLPKYLE